jgi:hypothetical protein
MAIDGSQVRVAGGGHVYVAAKGTVLPKDLADLDPTKFFDLGYVTEDGVAFSFGRESEDINAWQGDKVKVITTKEPASVKFSLMQTNADTVKVAFGGGSITSSGTAPNEVYTFTPPPTGTNTERVLVIEFADGDAKYRYLLPRTQIEGTIEYTLTRNGAVTYPLEFGILDNGDSPKFEIVSNDPAMKTSPVSPTAAASK